MKLRIIIGLLLLTGTMWTMDRVMAQPFAFMDTSLTDDERIDNLISLMTLEEKVNHLGSRLPGISCIGLKSTRIVEGLHGLALSGPAN